MNIGELNLFMSERMLTAEHIAMILGVTKQAVDHWLFGRRKIPMTAAKVIRFLNKRPDLIQEFAS